MTHLILSLGYQDYAVELTPEVAQAIPAILAAKKVIHRSGHTFEESFERSDLKISIVEVVANADN